MNNTELLSILKENKIFINPTQDAYLDMKNCGHIHVPYQPTEQYETTDMFDSLYVSDDLISNRIKWESKEAVSVDYYDIKDLGIPWWKIWIDKVDLCNIKNKKLWQEAVAVAHVKHLPPVPSPLRSVR